MARLKIYTFPDIVLKQTASPVERVEKSMHSLADDMLETMYGAPGIGLAANQVGILQRILVIDTDYDSLDPDEAEEATQNGEMQGEVVAGRILVHRKPIIIINPEIIYKEGEISLNEGCLSVPSYNAEVKRAEKIKVQYQDIDGLTHVLSAEDLQAVCIQHEMDHLNGKLFIDRLSPLKKQMAKKQLLKERKEREEEEGS